MGTLKRTTGDQECWLSGRVLVGRAPFCLLRIRDRRVSGEHARMEFRAGAWEVRDLGSRNGTLVNGQRLTPGETCPLQGGDVLCFGSPTEAWRLVDASPPVALAVEADGGAVLRAQDGFLAIPEDQAPEVYAYAAEDGGWVAEQGERCWPVRDQERISAGGRDWTLHLPDGLDATWTPRATAASMRSLALRFEVSRDEEHVAIYYTRPDGEARLPSRAHDYMLLTLARARITDADAGVSPPEQGWLHVDDLCRMLRIDDNKLGVDIYRARKSAAEQGIQDAAALVERRRSTRQLRLGVPRLSVHTV